MCVYLCARWLLPSIWWQQLKNVRHVNYYWWWGIFASFIKQRCISLWLPFTASREFKCVTGSAKFGFMCSSVCVFGSAVRAADQLKGLRMFVCVRACVCVCVCVCVCKTRRGLEPDRLSLRPRGPLPINKQEKKGARQTLETLIIEQTCGCCHTPTETPTLGNNSTVVSSRQGGKLKFSRN